MTAGCSLKCWTVVFICLITPSLLLSHPTDGDDTHSWRGLLAQLPTDQRFILSCMPKDIVSDEAKQAFLLKINKRQDICPNTIMSEYFAMIDENHGGKLSNRNKARVVNELWMAWDNAGGNNPLRETFGLQWSRYRYSSATYGGVRITHKLYRSLEGGMSKVAKKLKKYITKGKKLTASHFHKNEKNSSSHQRSYVQAKELYTFISTIPYTHLEVVTQLLIELVRNNKKNGNKGDSLFWKKLIDLHMNLKTIAWRSQLLLIIDTANETFDALDKKKQFINRFLKKFRSKHQGFHLSNLPKDTLVKLYETLLLYGDRAMRQQLKQIIQSEAAAASPCT